MTGHQETSTTTVDPSTLYRSLRQTTENDYPEFVSGFEIRFTVSTGARHRYRFEPRQITPGWWRFEDKWTGASWRPIGRESIQKVALCVTGASREDSDER